MPPATRYNTSRNLIQLGQSEKPKYGMFCLWFDLTGNVRYKLPAIMFILVISIAVRPSHVQLIQEGKPLSPRYVATVERSERIVEEL
jgi:hypothetical protein